MAAVETVDLKVHNKMGNKVSALIKMFESNPDDLVPPSTPKRRQNNVIVSDGGRYASRDVTGTWILIQSHGDGMRGQRKIETMRKIKPRKGFVKKLITRFGGCSACGDDH